MEVKDSGCETCDSGRCPHPKSGKCLQNRNIHIPVLLNLRGSCTTVFLNSFNMIIFFLQILWQEISSIPEAGWTPEGVCSHHERGLSRACRGWCQVSYHCTGDLCHFTLHSRPLGIISFISALPLNKESWDMCNLNLSLPFQNTTIIYLVVATGTIMETEVSRGIIGSPVGLELIIPSRRNGPW